LLQTCKLQANINQPPQAPGLDDCPRLEQNAQISTIQPQHEDWMIAPDFEITSNYQSSNPSAEIG